MNIYRMNKTMLLIGWWFAAFAVLTVIVGIYIMVSWVDFSSRCITAEGVITDIRKTYNRHSDSTNHTVMVRYIVDGETYDSKLDYYVSSMKVGQAVTVYCDPDDPYITMGKPYIACAAIAVFALIFGGVGFGMVGAEFRNKKIINRLAEEDKYIVLDSRTTERREVSANVKVNRVRYVQTDFVYRDQFGGEYIFSSRPYPPGKCPFDPYRDVTVYVDIENNPKKYYVYTEDQMRELSDRKNKFGDF